MAEEEREVTTRDLRDSGLYLEMVTSFRYLVQVISAADDDWPAVEKELFLGKGGLEEDDTHPEK